MDGKRGGGFGTGGRVGSSSTPSSSGSTPVRRPPPARRSISDIKSLAAKFDVPQASDSSSSGGPPKPRSKIPGLPATTGVGVGRFTKKLDNNNPSSSSVSKNSPAKWRRGSSPTKTKTTSAAAMENDDGESAGSAPRIGFVKTTAESPPLPSTSTSTSAATPLKTEISLKSEPEPEQLSKNKTDSAKISKNIIKSDVSGKDDEEILVENSPTSVSSPLSPESKKKSDPITTDKAADKSSSPTTSKRSITTDSINTTQNSKTADNPSSKSLHSPRLTKLPHVDSNDEPVSPKTKGPNKDDSQPSSSSSPTKTRLLEDPKNEKPFLPPTSSNKETLIPPDTSGGYQIDDHEGKPKEDDLQRAENKPNEDDLQKAVRESPDAKEEEDEDIPSSSTPAQNSSQSRSSSPEVTFSFSLPSTTAAVPQQQEEATENELNKQDPLTAADEDVYLEPVKEEDEDDDDDEEDKGIEVTLTLPLSNKQLFPSQSLLDNDDAAEEANNEEEESSTTTFSVNETISLPLSGSTSAPSYATAMEEVPPSPPPMQSPKRNRVIGDKEPINDHERQQEQQQEEPNDEQQQEEPNDETQQEEPNDEQKREQELTDEQQRENPNDNLSRRSTTPDSSTQNERSSGAEEPKSERRKEGKNTSDQEEKDEEKEEEKEEKEDEEEEMEEEEEEEKEMEKQPCRRKKLVIHDRSSGDPQNNKEHLAPITVGKVEPIVEIPTSHPTTNPNLHQQMTSEEEGSSIISPTSDSSKTEPIVCLPKDTDAAVGKDPHSMINKTSPKLAKKRRQMLKFGTTQSNKRSKQRQDEDHNKPKKVQPNQKTSFLPCIQPHKMTRSIEIDSSSDSGNDVDEEKGGKTTGSRKLQVAHPLIHQPDQIVEIVNEVANKDGGQQEEDGGGGQQQSLCRPETSTIDLTTNAADLLLPPPIDADDKTVEVDVDSPVPAVIAAVENEEDNSKDSVQKPSAGDYNEIDSPGGHSSPIPHHSAVIIQTLSPLEDNLIDLETGDGGGGGSGESSASENHETITTNYVTTVHDFGGSSSSKRQPPSKSKSVRVSLTSDDNSLSPPTTLSYPTTPPRRTVRSPSIMFTEHFDRVLANLAELPPALRIKLGAARNSLTSAVHPPDVRRKLYEARDSIAETTVRLKSQQPSQADLRKKLAAARQSFHNVRFAETVQSIPPRLSDALDETELMPSVVDRKYPGGRRGLAFTACLLLVLLLFVLLGLLIWWGTMIPLEKYTRILATGGFGKEHRIEIYSPFYKWKNYVLKSRLPGLGRSRHMSLYYETIKNDPKYASGGALIHRYLLVGGTDSRGDTLRSCDWIDLLVDSIDDSDDGQGDDSGGGGGEIAVFNGPNMKRARAYAAGVVLRGVPYVCGGYDMETKEELDSCEKLNVTQDWRGVWEAGVSMRERRRGPAAVLLNGWIYMIGGRGDNLRDLKSVERYSDTKFAWERVADMNRARMEAAASTLTGDVADGRIYVCGGYFAGWDLDSCERYDPTTDKWTYITPMKSQRRDFGLFPIGNHLIALGGMYLNCGEEYDPHQDEWTNSQTQSCLLNKAWSPAYALIPPTGSN